MSQHVRLGFRSQICRNGEKEFGFCDLGDEELFLVADMNCERD